MSTQAKNKNEQLAQEVRIKNRIIFVLLGIIGFALYKFSTYPQQLTIHTAPDISKSFVQKVGDTPSQTVYGFARTIWELLNYCETDCSQEYIEKLNTYNVYLTKSCHKELSDHFYKNKDLYSKRARRLLPTDEAMYDVKRVKKVSSDTWYLYLQYLLDDDIGSITTRRQIMEYPLIVTSSGVPTQYNPWGLSINCYWDKIRVTEYKPLKEIQ